MSSDNINLFPEWQTIHGYAEKVPTHPNVVSVGAHGDQLGIENSIRVPISEGGLTETIRAHPEFPNATCVDLVSCKVGQGEAPYAQRLANELNLPVRAADDTVWISQDGRLEVAGEDENGRMDRSKPGSVRTFVPKKDC